MSAANVVVLSLRGVSRIYGAGRTAVTALRALDLDVHAGELLAVMGPSGSGKSTLLALCGALDRPTAGRIVLGDLDLGAASARDLAALRRRTLGYVFQDFNLVPSLTALENVALPLELDGVGLRAARAQAEQALAAVELAALAERFPDDLSGGEQQRVAIARACVGPRRLLLADEPTGALDSVTGEAVMRLLRAHCDGGRSAVLVTHDATHAAWADRIVYLRDGALVDTTGAPPRDPGRSPDAAPRRAGAAVIAAVRPLLRIELRQAWRHRGRSSLIVALIAVPVAALVGGSTLVRALERPTGESIAPAVFVLGSLGFIEAALVIAAAFAVGLRRRQREVGLLAATGAEPPAVLAAILGSAGLLALVGGGLGASLGLGVAAALVPHVEVWLGCALAEFAVPWPQLVGALALGALAALLSAWWPARAALRAPVRDALAGRRPPLGVTAPWARAGFALLAFGAAGVGLGSRLDESLGAIANVLGSACCVLGLGACCPWLLERLARHAARLPLAWRLAAREAGRLRHRDGPVVAAILAAMAVSVTASSLCASVAAADAALAPAAEPNPGPELLARAVLLLAVAAGVTVLLAANALTAVEAAGERRTFAAVGAPPGVIRRFAGARAAVLGVLGCSLAVPAGLLTALGITAVDPGLDFVVPRDGLFAAWLTLPILAYLVAWGTARPLS